MLSIAIPTFGKSRFLEQCLQSVKVQTQHIQCVVCDGGSEFDFSDPAWSWVYNKSMVPDPGITQCWSEAANCGQGEYLAFLADDNTLEPQFAEKMLTFMEAYPKCDVVFCNQLLMDEKGIVDLEASYKMTEGYGRDKLKYGLLSHDSTAYLIEYNSIPIEACVMKRSIWEQYGPFSQEAHGAFDLHFLIKLLVNNVQFGFVPDYLMKFRINSESYTLRRRAEHIRGRLWSLENLETKNPVFQSLIQIKIFDCHKNLLKLSLPSQERQKSENYILKHSNTGFLTVLKLRLHCTLRKFLKGS
jgi:glycosyltransferase involved in cell wall biosynthesis